MLAVLGFPHLQHTKALPLSQLLDVLKLVLGTVAGVGALFALVMAYRRQRLAEVAEVREHQRTRDDLTRVFNERFGAASAQLGHGEPAVRLAGAYAMAGLADDWAQGRQTCIDVLCAVLRLPYATHPGEDPAEGQDPAEHAAAYAAYRADREVRHTIIRIIGNHLNGHADLSWRGYDLDFTNAVFDGGDFHGAVFAGTVSFQGARFLGGTVTFEDARFTDGTVTFEAAEFEGGTVTFHRARFEGHSVQFNRAGFKGGMVDFGSARFLSGGTVVFSGARFLGGTVTFQGARFEDGTVRFGGALFAGGTVLFNAARFEGGMVTFHRARFEGDNVSFRETTGRRPDGLPDGLAPHLS
ncbi:pentapeptide repeat-containing protein [Actinomadura luteofluorescens]|uniref:pentapeptide repeat-containing protein n=1 Tax=Actinomadura luteofluorescens TaxID=46163 RepID=UPI003795FE7B